VREGDKVKTTNTFRPILQELVRKEWVDFNGHMNDAAYAHVFSISCNKLLEHIGLNSEDSGINIFSIFTLENHICYYRETRIGELLFIKVGIVDYDIKRLHSFFIMENEVNECLATSEQLLIGIDMKSRRVAPFPTNILNKITNMFILDQKIDFNYEVGKNISIRKKN
jgi:acyl-CoA thioester hydrolase